jgi:hypothetical protein
MKSKNHDSSRAHTPATQITAVHAIFPQPKQKKPHEMR